MKAYDEFTCRVRKLPALILLIFPSMAGVSFVRMPYRNHHGVRVTRLIENLGPDASTLLFFSMAGFCFLLAALGLRMLVASFGGPTKIIITDTLLVMPKNGVSKIMLRIPVSTITRTWIQTVGSQKILHIKSGSKEHLISSAALSRASDVEDIHQLIETHRAPGA